jgi:hypothetical protein
MIFAVSVKNKVILELSNPAIAYRVERKRGSAGEWLVLTSSGWARDEEGADPVSVRRVFLDDQVEDGIYQYRARAFDNPAAPYEPSLWVRCGNTGPMGYTFGNYRAPEGEWGEILTPDDMRYTYMWGIDARATNGASYADEQIRFHIESSLAEMERRLNITIRKRRIACEPVKRNLREGIDYDEEESYYSFRRERIQRSGMITTRRRPVLKVSRLDLLSRNNPMFSLLGALTVDKTKGLLRFFNRPLGVGDTGRAIQNALYPYGADTFDSQLFYAVDYEAGFESADAIPKDLRAAIGKTCAIELLNIIGDGLMAGFSSSSLSLDGVSESFSSTQSATSATYGALIKAYTDELEDYIKANKLKFGTMTLGAL